MKIAVIDNFDSFVFNLVRYLKESTSGEIIIQRNNQVDYTILDSCDAILLSPGPGIPREAGELISIIKKYSGKKKILGICLGHQAIAEAFGGKLEHCESPMHGKSNLVKQIDEDALFTGISKNFQVGRYHSWKVNNKLPKDLITTVISQENEIMALRHKIHDTRGMQFHPESILTPDGRKMIENWVNQIHS